MWRSELRLDMIDNLQEFKGNILWLFDRGSMYYISRQGEHSLVSDMPGHIIAQLDELF